MKENYQKLQILSLAQVCLLLVFASFSSMGLCAQEMSETSGSEPVIDVIHGITEYSSVGTTRGELMAPAVELIDLLEDGDEDRGLEEATIRPDLNGVDNNDRYLDGDLEEYGLGYGDSWVAYPNPSRGMLNLEFKDDANRTIVVYNMIGQAVYQTENAGQSKMSVDLGHLHEGMYIIQVMRGEELTTKRVEIAH